MKKELKAHFVQGNNALAEGAIAAGCRFFAGYPITPSSEIAETLSRRFPMIGGRFIQMEDEISAMGAVIGASLAGEKALTATSGPGFSLKIENIGYAVITETPCVIVNVMRGGPSTGAPTGPSQSDVQQARWGPHGDHQTIALAPSTVDEIFWETIRAFNLAEKYRTPVIIMLDEILGHMRERIVYPDPSDVKIVNRLKPDLPPGEYVPPGHDDCEVPPMANFGDGYRFHVTGLCHNEYGLPTNNPDVVESLIKRLTRKIENNRAEIIKTQSFFLDDAEVAVFAYGSSARSAKRAVIEAREAGMKIGLLKADTLWPFPDEIVLALADQVKAIIVPEMNLGQMAREVERAVRGKVPVHRVNLVSTDPITPRMIVAKAKEAL